jgi:hypothetical protein
MIQFDDDSSAKPIGELDQTLIETYEQESPTCGSCFSNLVLNNGNILSDFLNSANNTIQFPKTKANRNNADTHAPNIFFALSVNPTTVAFSLSISFALSNNLSHSVFAFPKPFSNHRSRLNA